MKSLSRVCLTLCDPMDCSLPGSSVHGIFQARVLEWVAISFSKKAFKLYQMQGLPWSRMRFQWFWNSVSVRKCIWGPGLVVGTLPDLLSCWDWVGCSVSWMSSESISHLGDKGLSPAFSSMLGSFGRKPSPALDGSPSLFFFFPETEGSFGTFTTCLDDKGSNS